MKKESFADKMARKAFEKDDVKKSWETHVRAFGPILEPAFQHNLQARVHLTAALNMLSNRNPAGALLKLKALQKSVLTEADKAALFFCFGLYGEMTGSQEQMVTYYTYANKCGHRFYLPYLKVAKFCLSNRIYEEAEKNFREAISCFTATGLNDADRIILGSAYCNLASCLTMQHRYDEAEAALASSRSVCAEAPGRASAEVVLHALRGETEQVEQCLKVLKNQAPQAFDTVKESIDKILAGTDPMFFPQPVEDEKITAFWQWFAGYQAEMKKLLDKKKYDDGLTPMAKQLLVTFPFLEEVPNVGLGMNKQGYVVELKDYYAVGIVAAYEKLLEQCPGEIKENWQFVIAH